MIAPFLTPTIPDDESIFSVIKTDGNPAVFFITGNQINHKYIYVTINLMFRNYDFKIKKILSENNSETDWKKLLGNHQEMIAKIQHERLVHLLVTIFVGTIMSIVSFITLITKDLFLLIFSLPLMLLFLGYLLHYRFLENTTQNWYLLEDQIKKHL